MKKIGIFTFFQTNYGAILQAYSLQNYLQNRPDAEVEIVDFTTPRHLEDHRIFKPQNTKNPLYLLAYYFFTLLHYGQLKRRIVRTNDFKKRYFRFTRRYASVQDLLDNHPVEDIYITGSDQVFNPNARYVPVYYLDFDKKGGKKIAYAPSFGVSSFNDDITAKVLPYLKDFDGLSCREPGGAEYISGLLQASAPVVADPVFLHCAEEWNAIAIEPEYKNDYIFIYDLNGKENLVKIAGKIRKHIDENLKIVCLTADRMKNYAVDKQIYDAGPAEFVGWIKNAKYVVTDSFHGTAFSLIYRKPFYVYVALERASERITNILSRTNSLDRMLRHSDLGSFGLTKNLNGIDYASLEMFIEDSKKYIDTFLC